MKLECKVEKIKNAIANAERITGKNLTLPVLNSILLIAEGKFLKLKAVNLSLGVEIEVSAQIESEGILAVPGGVLNNVFSNFPLNEKVTLEEVDGNLLIKTSRSKIRLKCIPYGDFPSIPVVSGSSFKIQSKKLIDGIKSVYYASAVTDVKPEISSVYMYGDDENLVFVSTDSFRLAEKKVKVKNLIEIEGILIPFKNVVEILKVFGDVDDDIEVCFDKNQISFSTFDIYLTSRVIDGVFPDYRQIIPKEFKTEAVVLKKDLLNALKISNIFSDKFNQLDMSVKMSDKVLELSSVNNDIGDNKTRLAATLEGEDVDLGFNYKYFLDCISSVHTDSLTVLLNDSSRPMVVKPVSDRTFTYLIMPMNR